MIVLAVDPGRMAGWAIMSPWLLHGYGVILDATGQQIGDVIYGAQKNGIGPDVCIIEGQYLSGKPAQGYSMMSCIRNAGAWRGVSELMGVRMFSADGVLATKWRPYLWGGGKWTRQQAKKKSLDYVQRRWKLKLLDRDNHAAEAICMAEYALLEMGAK